MALSHDDSIINIIAAVIIIFIITPQRKCQLCYLLRPFSSWVSLADVAVHWQAEQHLNKHSAQTV